MGLSNSGTDKTYVSIVGASFVVRVKDGVDGAVARVLKKGKNEGKTVFELHYDKLIGVITNLEYQSKEFGVYLAITIMDDKEYTLNIPWSNFSLRDAVVKRLPNLNHLKPVEMSVFRDKDGERAVLVIRQDNELVAYKFTKEQPNGIPEAEKVMVRGESKWDFTKAENFLYDVFMSESKRFNKEVSTPHDTDDINHPDNQPDDILHDCDGEAPPF